MNGLEKLKKNELEELSKLLKEDPKKLQEEITSRLAFLQSQKEKVTRENYSSGRNPYYAADLEYQVNSFLQQIQIQEIPFLRQTFSSYINIMMENYTRQNPSNQPTLSDLETAFQGVLKRNIYEDEYNTLNYIKTYFYYLKGVGQDLSKEQIIEGWDRKKKIVTPMLPEIAAYLYDITEKTPLKSSVSNASLHRLMIKTPRDILTRNERMLLDAIAFGSDEDKLREGNFEDAKRLIYLPKTKRK